MKKKHIKRTMLSLVMALVFTVTCSAGLVGSVVNTAHAPAVSAVQNGARTAQNSAAVGVSEYDAMKNSLLSIGGEVYSSQEEYDRAQTAAAVKTEYTAHAASPVTQTVTILSTATGSKAHGNYVPSKPISNAVVRVDGVPRFSDRQGKVKFTTSRPYAEIFVEKNDYNPYVDILKIKGDDREIHLKVPSDDIDIYAVLFEYEGHKFNVLSQPCYINMLMNTSYSELTVKCNVDADEYFLLRNGVIIDYSSDGVFEYFDYSKFTENDRFAVQVQYQGIESKTVPIELYLGTPKIDEKQLTEMLNAELSDVQRATSAKGITNGNLNISDDKGVGNIATIDTSIFEMVHEFLISTFNKGSYDVKIGNVELQFDYVYNPYTGDVEGSIGFGFSRNLKKDPRLSQVQSKLDEYKSKQEQYGQAIKNKKAEIVETKNEIKRLKQEDKNAEKIARQEERLKSQKSELNAAQAEGKSVLDDVKGLEREKSSTLNEYRESVKQDQDNVSDMLNKVKQGKESLQNLRRLINGMPGTEPKLLHAKNLLSNKALNLNLDFQFFGKFTYNMKNRNFTNLKLNGEVQIKVGYNHAFMLWIVPCFLYGEIHGGGGINVILVNNGEIYSFIEILRNIEFYLTFGIRIELGVGINGLASVSGFTTTDFRAEINFSTKETRGQLFITAGLKAQFLFFKREISHLFQIPLWNTVQANTQLLNRSVRLAGVDVNSSILFDNVYQCSNAQVFECGGEKVMVWLEDATTRDEYNRTVLKLAVSDGDGWGKPISVLNDGNADFYPDIMTDGDRVYITWQKSNRQFCEDDTPENMMRAGEIYAAAFDVPSRRVTNVTRLTENDRMDAAPVFALNEGGSSYSILWQSNSENDLFGFNGVNSVYTRSFQNGVWTEEQQIFETEKILYTVTGRADRDGVSAAVLTDGDGDLSTFDGEIVAISTEGQRRLPIQDVLRAEYIMLDGVPTLTYFDGKSIVIAGGSRDGQILIDGSDFGLNKDYSVTDTPRETAIFYHKIAGERTQGYAAIFDKASRTWTTDIPLTAEKGNCDGFSGVVSADGGIEYYYRLNVDGSTALCAAKKERQADFVIGDRYIDGKIASGEDIRIVFDVENVGDYALPVTAVRGFGQTVAVIKPQIAVGASSEVEVVFSAVQMSGQPYETVTVIAEDVNGNPIERSIEINVTYVDVALIAELQIVDGKQNFTARVLNRGASDTAAELVVYKNGVLYNKMNLVLSAEAERTVNIVFDEIDEGDYIYIAIEPNGEDVSTVDNESGIFAVQSERLNHSSTNPYYDAMQIVKALMR